MTLPPRSGVRAGHASPTTAASTKCASAARGVGAIRHNSDNPGTWAGVSGRYARGFRQGSWIRVSVGSPAEARVLLWKLQVAVKKFKPVLRRLSGPREDTEENRFSQSSCAASRTGSALTPARDRRRLLASLQLLQQPFRFASVGEGHARAEQRLERCPRVSRPAEPVERDGQVILNIGVFRSREVRGAQIC
jgi:hypothetical protein